MIFNNNFKSIFVSFLYTIPAIFAAIGLVDSPGFNIFVHGEGAEILWRNIHVLVLALYLPIFLYGIGLTVRNACAQKISGLISQSDEDLLLILCGSGMVVVIGAVMAFMGFTNRPVNGAIFCITIFFVFIKDQRILNRWMMYVMALPSSYNNIRSDTKLERYIIFVLNLIFILLSLLIIITRGIHIEFTDWDAFAMYFPYLTEIFRNGGTQMDPNFPYVLNFLAGRGRGLYIFFSSISDEAGSQIVSAMYFLLLALLGGKLISNIFVDSKDIRYGHTAIKIAPAFTRVLILFTPIEALSYVRYHLESGTQSVFFLWVWILLIATRISDQKPLFRLALPVALALPIAFPQYSIFVVILFLGMIALAKMFKKLCCIGTFYQITFAGVVACAASICFNWIYVGIPVIVPYSIFEQFIIDDIFSNWIGRVGFNWFDYQNKHFDFNLGFFPLIINYIEGFGIKLSSMIGYIFPLTHRRYIAFPIFIFALLINTKSMKIDRFRIILVLTLASSLLMIGLQVRYIGDIGSFAGSISSIQNQFRPLNVFLDMFMLTIVLYAIVYASSNFKIQNFKAALSYIRLESIAAIAFYWFVSVSFLLILGEEKSLGRLLWHSEILPQIFTIFFAVACVSFIDFVLKHPQQRLSLPWWVIGIVMTAMIVRELQFQFKHSGFINFPMFYPIIGGIIGMVMATTVLGRPFWNNMINVRPALFFSKSPFVMTITTCLVLFGFIVQDVGSWALAKRGAREVLGGIQFFVGYHGLNITQPTKRVTCQIVDKISKVLPGPETIYFMNGHIEFCAITKLLRGKVPHHQNSFIPKYFSKLVLASADEAVDTYKRLSINYFGFVRDEPPFTGPGFSELVDSRHLSDYFDLFYSDSQMIILTWKGQGKAPLPHNEEMAILKMRDQSLKKANGEPTKALLAFRKLQSTLL